MEDDGLLYHSRLRLTIPFLLSGLVLWILPPAMASSFGINYGQVANNLPPPEKVVPLVRAVGATRLKLYDADPKVLKAFVNTSVEFVVSIPNEDLSGMRDPAKAEAWVKQNVEAYLPATRIACIAVGNEVLTLNDTTLSGNLLPAMQSIHTALVNLGLDASVKVTTAHSLAVLETSYPPSAGSFRPDLIKCICRILEFHTKTGSPFLINAYPYFAYKANPKQVSLDFVLFQPNDGIVDPKTNLHYDNMLFAQIDAVHSALGPLGYRNVCVQISETGWPSKGDADEAGASPENARKYNCNLMHLVTQKKGTPMRPQEELNIFVFAMFNENLKPGPASERNYGLFKPDGTPAYFLGITISTNTTASSSSTATGNNTPPVFLPPPSTSSPLAPSASGYLSISSDSVRLLKLCSRVRVVLGAVLLQVLF